MDRRSWIGGALAIAYLNATAGPNESAPTLRMAYFDKYPPMSSLDAHGNLTGLLIDGVSLVCEAAGLRTAHQAYPWARAQALVENGRLDGFCTTPTTLRKRYARFCSMPIFVARFGVFHRVDDERPKHIRTWSDMQALRQGTYIGSGYSRQYSDKVRLHMEASPDAVLRLINIGALDIYIESELVTNHKLREMGIFERFAFTPLDLLPPANFCLGLRTSLENSTALIARIEDSTARLLKDGSLKAIWTKYGVAG